MRLDEYLAVDDGQVVCRKCGYALCGKDENYKEHAAGLVRDFCEMGLLRRPQSDLIDRKVVFRQFFCPGCFTNIENETVLEGVAPIHDKQLH